MNIKLNYATFLMFGFLATGIFSQEKAKKTSVVSSQIISTTNNEVNRDAFNKNNSEFSARTLSTTGSDTDVGMPAISPFQLGEDLHGSIQNSVNQVTGKIAFSVPITNINAETISYPISLGYNGQSALKIGKETNKYSPVSKVAVGWDFSSPKIIVDNKKTGTQEDDTFYLIDGGASSKLICTKTSGNNLWEFESEKFTQWKIKYFRGETNLVSVGGVQFWQFNHNKDYWVITKDDGKEYYFGYIDLPTANSSAPISLSKSKEHVIKWGNWIGDSKQSGGEEQTIAWNLSRIEDTWGNQLNYKYELQEVVMSGKKQTEASYLKEISSTNGSKIVFTYGNKISQEYYEPNTEQPEPDAYQERYEKKYLQNIKTYNTSNELVYTHKLIHELTDTSNPQRLHSGKRYLKEILQEDKNGVALPSQKFEYYTSGSYKGGLSKMYYPTGGSVKYNYNNKLVFNNNADLFDVTPPAQIGYSYYSTYVRDNYNLMFYRSNDPISGNKYRFKVLRYWWNGLKWESNEFIIPNLIEDTYPQGQIDQWAEGLNIVYKNNFYAFSINDNDKADIYLFHLNPDGRSWNYRFNTNINIGEGDPKLLSGDEFIALGSHRSGRMDIFTWKGDKWFYEIINQGVGQYYYGATNNYIISLDENGGNDMVTSINYPDNYYFHYLDINKDWKTKSWSATANNAMATIEKPSHFFPSNSIIGFVADDNPEYFLRWDTDFNLTNIDNVIGGYDDNSHAFYPVNNNLFTLVNSFQKKPIKSARFDGVNWSVLSLPANYEFYSAINLGLDMFSYEYQSYGNTPVKVGFKRFNPNNNSWFSQDLHTLLRNIYMEHNVNSEFIVAGNFVYENKFFQAQTSLPILGTMPHYNFNTSSDGLSHSFVKLHATNSLSDFLKGRFYYINKENGLLNFIDINDYYMMDSRPNLGGYNTSLSPKTIRVRTENTNCVSSGNNSVTCSFSHKIYRIIDDKFNSSVYNTVVDNLELDDDNGSIRKIHYTYNNPNPTPDNSSTYYGEVIVENKGSGNGNIGKIKRIFDTGLNDLRTTGLLKEEYIINANNDTEQKKVFTWNKVIMNSGRSYFIRQTQIKEELYLSGNTVVSETSNYFNNKGELLSTSTIDSKGRVEKTEMLYAYNQYDFMRDKNMLSYPFKNSRKLDNKEVSVEMTKWTNNNGKIYAFEKEIGSSTNNLRVINNVSKVNSKGNILENNNGKGIYTTFLFGHNNLRQVATISNARYQDVINALDVSENELQTLDTQNLKTELFKLYSRLPNAMVELTFYDNNGRVINQINQRKKEAFMFYDDFGRLDYITDGENNVIEKKEYNYGN